LVEQCPFKGTTALGEPSLGKQKRDANEFHGVPVLYKQNKQIDTRHDAPSDGKDT